MFVCSPPMDSHCPSGNGPNALAQPELDSGSFPAHLWLSTFSALLSQASCTLNPLSDKDCRHLPRPPFCFLPTAFMSATFCLRSFKSQVQDFPGCSVVNNPPANAGNMSSIPGPGRSHTPRSNKAHEPQQEKPLKRKSHIPQRNVPLLTATRRSRCAAKENPVQAKNEINNIIFKMHV